MMRLPQIKLTPPKLTQCSPLCFQGGMSEVLRWRDTTGVDRVVKMSTTADANSDIEQEYDFVSQLGHPNIIRVTGMFAAGDRVCFEMIMHSNGDLVSLIQKRAGLIKKRTGRPVGINSQEMHRWMVGLLSAMEYVHNLDVVHRDIKPANLLFDDAWNIVLCDFGLACVVPVPAGDEAGTKLFMAPEVGVFPYGTPADVWSLSCVVHACVTGDASGSSTSTKQQLLPHPRWVGSLLTTAGSEDPQQRPTAKAFRQYIGAQTGDFGVSAKLQQIQGAPLAQMRRMERIARKTSAQTQAVMKVGGKPKPTRCLSTSEIKAKNFSRNQRRRAARGVYKSVDMLFLPKKK